MCSFCKHNNQYTFKGGYFDLYLDMVNVALMIKPNTDKMEYFFKQEGFHVSYCPLCGRDLSVKQSKE